MCALARHTELGAAAEAPAARRRAVRRRAEPAAGRLCRVRGKGDAHHAVGPAGGAAVGVIREAAAIVRSHLLLGRRRRDLVGLEAHPRQWVDGLAVHGLQLLPRRLGRHRRLRLAHHLLELGGALRFRFRRRLRRADSERDDRRACEPRRLCRPVEANEDRPRARRLGAHLAHAAHRRRRHRRPPREAHQLRPAHLAPCHLLALHLLARSAAVRPAHALARGDRRARRPLAGHLGVDNRRCLDRAHPRGGGSARRRPLGDRWHGRQRRPLATRCALDAALGVDRAFQVALAEGVEAVGVVDARQRKEGVAHPAQRVERTVEPRALRCQGARLGECAGVFDADDVEFVVGWCETAKCLRSGDQGRRRRRVVAVYDVRALAHAAVLLSLHLRA